METFSFVLVLKRFKQKNIEKMAKANKNCAKKENWKHKKLILILIISFKYKKIYNI